MSHTSSIARSLVSVSLAALAWLSASVALAINQPDGTPIPATSALQSVFTARGESLNALTDAALTPERFVPGCRLTFTLATRGPALFRNSFGWYNATGRAPTDADLHPLIGCDAPQGFVATLDLTREPAYMGGEIGFFLRTPEDGASGTCAGGDCCARPGRVGRTYFSERRFNPDSLESGGSGYVHLLTYDSRAMRDGFYFAWEDLFRGGDNNFTDFVALVSNIVCSGGGGRCDTGMPGVCANGTLQCRAGALACAASTVASAERCDGQDNDCNGSVDEGDSLCPSGQVCDRGTCVPPCLERSCFEGFRCSERGTCVEDACAMVSCPSGQRCEAGRCLAACDGIVCPGAQQCRAGRCVDPCEGVRCDADQVCVGGTCSPRCQCRRCPASETCQTDGRCVATDCAAVSCPLGQQCISGACRDACTNARCPLGERCETGACIRVASGVDAGTVDASPGFDGGPAMDGSATTQDASRDVTGSDVLPPLGPPPGRGCSCRTSPSESETRDAAGPLLGSLLLLAIARRRDGRRAAPARG
ncbi:MAG: DUF4114 domain-containing protein [Deltaproteobacteria bacterium]|nr:DUF4114 domain-containing protein [Deltaproteobacteria bacterium]